MDLIERYLAEIGRHLPARQAADIEGELREELLSRQEEREAELGHALSRRDVEALLLEFGHPLAVAARYRRTHHLIGPEVYPFWLSTVRWSLLVLAIVYAVLLTLAELLGRTHADMMGIGRDVVIMGFFLVGVITVAFAAFERAGRTRFLLNWKPSQLPPPNRAARPRATLVAEMAMDGVFILWWLGLIHFQSLIPFPAQITVSLAPVWAAWRWPILVYALWELAADLLAIARPEWVRTNTGLFVGRYLYGVAILSQVLQAGHWVAVDSPVIAPPVLSGIQANFDLGMRLGVGATILGLCLATGLQLWRGYRQQGRVPIAA